METSVEIIAGLARWCKAAKRRLISFLNSNFAAVLKSVLSIKDGFLLLIAINQP